MCYLSAARRRLICLQGCSRGAQLAGQFVGFTLCLLQRLSKTSALDLQAYGPFMLFSSFLDGTFEFVQKPHVLMPSPRCCGVLNGIGRVGEIARTLQFLIKCCRMVKI